MGAASGLSDHDFSFSAVFTHILHLGRKLARSSGHRAPVLNPDDRQSVNLLIRLRLIRVCTIFPNLSANIYNFYGNCISASGLESTLFSRQIYLDYVTYLRQKDMTYLTIVGGESRP